MEKETVIKTTMKDTEYYDELREMFTEANGFIRPRFLPFTEVDIDIARNRKSIEIDGVIHYRVGYFVALMYEGVLRIGVSRCSDLDQFDKRFGKWLAIKRAVNDRWSPATLVAKMQKEPDWEDFQEFTREAVKRVMFPTIKHMKDADLTPEALEFIHAYEADNSLA